MAISFPRMRFVLDSFHVHQLLCGIRKLILLEYAEYGALAPMRGRIEVGNAFVGLETFYTGKRGFYYNIPHVPHVPKINDDDDISVKYTQIRKTLLYPPHKMSIEDSRWKGRVVSFYYATVEEILKKEDIQEFGYKNEEQLRRHLGKLYTVSLCPIVMQIELLEEKEFEECRSKTILPKKNWLVHDPNMSRKGMEAAKFRRENPGKELPYHLLPAKVQRRISKGLGYTRELRALID
jgi:hypothetical protein